MLTRTAIIGVLIPPGRYTPTVGAAVVLTSLKGKDIHAAEVFKFLVIHRFFLQLYQLALLRLAASFLNTPTR